MDLQKPFILIFLLKWKTNQYYVAFIVHLKLSGWDHIIWITDNLLTILQVGVQGSSPELLSVDREINVPQSCIFSKHFVSRTSLVYAFFPFRWMSMLSGHLSLDFPIGLFPFIFTFQPSALTLPLSSGHGQIIEVSSYWLLWTICSILFFLYVFISLSDPSGEALCHFDNFHVCCCNLLL